MTVTVTPLRFRPEEKSPFSWSSKTLDPQAVRINSFGLPYRRMQPVDAPAAPLNKYLQSDLKSVMQAQWGFSNGDDVRQTCEGILRDGIHYRIFDAMIAPTTVLMRMKSADAPPLDFRTQADLFTNFLRGLYHYNGFDAQEWSTQFQHWIDLCTSEEFLRVAPDRIARTTRAWDLLRIEVTAGSAVGLGWLSPEEGQDYGRRALAELQRTFTTWQQVAQSFWWGRAIWQADEPRDIDRVTMFDDLFSIALTHPDSPWVKVPLHP